MPTLNSLIDTALDTFKADIAAQLATVKSAADNLNTEVAKLESMLSDTDTTSTTTSTTDSAAAETAGAADAPTSVVTG